MSVAKKAVDSTIRTILVYAVEIIAAIILLVLLCFPLVFAIPMWFQWVIFGTASSEMLLNPVTMFGAGTAVWITVILGLFSILLAYPYLMKIGSSGVSDKTEEEADASLEEESGDDEIEIEDILEEEEESED